MDTNMYTEKVSLSGTALSFLLYECVNSVNSQEGFLIGDVISELTNHISDSQSDNARLDTQIVIRTVLPVPSVSLFYFPTGRIKEDVLSDFLSESANEVVGWYKYRKNTNIKPTFRDKLIAKGLQKYFEKYYGKKTFVTCNLSNKITLGGSTHTFTYRFGKINYYNMYEYIEDVTGNLGEKLAGYRKTQRLLPNSVFNKVIKESNVQSNNMCNNYDAVLRLQDTVQTRLLKETLIASKSQNTIRELEAEIKQMSTILKDRHAAELQERYTRIFEEKYLNRKVEMSQACVDALKTSHTVNILNSKAPNVELNYNHIQDRQRTVDIDDDSNDFNTSSSFIPNTIKPPALNYAAALKNNSELPSTSNVNSFTEDLICFDGDDSRSVKNTIIKDDTQCISDSSPEY